jgi:hypothetical protein
MKMDDRYVIGAASPEIFNRVMTPSRYKALYGGRGCVHGLTMIDTVYGPIPISKFKGGYVYSQKGGEVVIRYATPSVKYAPVDLYEVIFSDGRKIICTDEHKFHTGRGWVTLERLTMSDVFSAVPRLGVFSRLRSILGIFRPAFPLDVQHLTETLEGLKYRCFEYFRQYGQRLPFLAGIGQGVFPSQDDARQHSRHALIGLGDPAFLRSYSQQQPLSRLSIQDAAPVSGGECFAKTGNHSDDKSSVSLLASCPQSRLFHVRTFLGMQESKPTLQGWAIYTLKGLAQSLQMLLCKPWRAVFGNPYLNSMFVGCDTPTILKLRHVIKHSRQHYWDLHVPETECYFAEGALHHNSGKSHFFAEALVGNAGENQGFRAVCVREVQKSLKESAKRLLEDKIKMMGYGDRFDVQRDQIITPGGGVIIFEGMNDHTAETIKSLEGFQVCWVEEAQTLSAKSLEMLRPTIRAPGSELWFSWNPRSKSDPVDHFFRGPMPPSNAIVEKINYTDNELFPVELEDDRLHDFKTNPDRYAHIWLGAYEPEALGAIWTRQVIEDNRLPEGPTLDRIVIGVDPAVTNTEISDTHGIVVCALGADGHGYVLEDASLKGTPHQWAHRALAMYDKWEADAIVIEVNQGGDMVRHTIESAGRGARIVEVRATRGKHVRAEPISALYSTGRIHHVGTFPELEDQLCKFTAHGYEGDDSPDRADAMIWCMTELFPKLTRTETKTETYIATGGAGAWMG